MKKTQTLSLDSVPGFGKLLKAFVSSANESLPASNYFDSTLVQNRLDFRTKFEHRDILFQRLTAQNSVIDISEKTRSNIELIKEKNTVCITTGHQLALMGGPLFVTYKILTAIKLCQQYKSQFPAYNFVPVYWLASEDHDFEEINNFTVHGKEFKWETQERGAVGKFSTQGISDLILQMENEINGLDPDLLSKFKLAYSKNNLSEATRFLANELFGQYGLIIIDGNDTTLKKLFVPVLEKEVQEKATFKNVSSTNKKLEEAGFEPAINPRELNLFFLTENDRKRLEFSNESVKTVDNTSSWSIHDFLKLIHESPEKISPNVLMRPVYQETILPNLAYIGGPAETEYWLQLDALFEANALKTPLRILRICNTLLSEKNHNKIYEAGLDMVSILEPEEVLSKKIATALGGDNLNFTKEKNDFSTLFDNLTAKAKQIDVTLEGTIKAEKARQEKALENVFSKLIKAEKNKQEAAISRMLKIRNSILPNGKPQERTSTLFELNNSNYQELFGFILNDADLNVMNIGLTA